MRSPTDLYIEQVNKQLVYSKKRKSEILQQLSADVEAFESTLDEECTLEVLEEEFGTPQHAAEAALRLEDLDTVKHKVNKKKVTIIVLVVTCSLVVLSILLHLVHLTQLQKDFASGYEYETITYDHQKVPEVIDSPPEHTRDY